MLKRILMVIMVSCLLPLMAYAATWTLNTQAKTIGGAIQIDDGPLQTSVQGSIFNNYTTNGTKTIKLIPNAGIMVASVNYNGTTLTKPSETTFTVGGPDAQVVTVTFGLLTNSITASVAGNIGGTVSKPSGVSNLAFGTVFTTAKTFTFTPLTGYIVDGITGIPAGATQVPVVPVRGQAVRVTFPAGYAVTTDAALVGTFSTDNPIAKAGKSQSVVAGSATTVILDGSGSVAGTNGITSYSWAQVSGPETVILSGAGTASATFTPTMVGSYVFSLTVMPGGSTSSTTVTVHDSLVQIARTNCVNCHMSAGKGIVTNVFGKWSSSGHKTKGLICVQCHVGNDSGGHPGKLRTGTVSGSTFNFNSASVGSGNYCVTCHTPTILTDFAASNHSIRAGSSSCGFCHVQGVHNPVAICTDCHKADNTYGLVWPPAAYTFHNSFSGSANNVCKACHTTHNPKVLSIKTSCP